MKLTFELEEGVGIHELVISLHSSQYRCGLLKKRFPWMNERVHSIKLEQGEIAEINAAFRGLSSKVNLILNVNWLPSQGVAYQEAQLNVCVNRAQQHIRIGNFERALLNGEDPFMDLRAEEKDAKGKVIELQPTFG